MTKKAHLIANTKSGKGTGASLPSIAASIAREFNVELVHHETENPADFERRIDEAVAAAQKDGGVVIAAGGDGTIRSVAEKAALGKVKFAAVACGTFNFFARNHGIPEDPAEAFRLALTGEVREVRLGKMNDHLFLINASLGLYAKSIKDRHENSKRFGRDRLVVILSTAKSLLGLHRSLTVDLVTDGVTKTVRTMSIFVGNNALQLRDLKLDVARCMKKELLAVVILKPVTRMEMLRILWRGISKTLEHEERLESFCVDKLTIHLPESRLTVALDGEMFVAKSPIVVESLPKVLRMVLPPKAPT